MILSKRSFLTLIFLILAFCLLLAVGPSNKTHAQEASDASKPVETYEYTAKSGDNLTYLVRKSVQLYAEAKNIDLNNAQKLYCETNVVQKLGSRQIDINEKISVPFAQLQKYLTTSRELSKAQQAAWQVYASNVDFELKNIAPTNIKEAQKTAKPNSSSTNTENKDEGTDKTSKKDNDSPSWVEWVVVILASAAVGYYFTKFKP